MAQWERVKWSEARQVLDLLGVEEKTEAEESLPPAAYFAFLRSRARQTEAAKFLAQALPRLEAVAWAARAVRDLGADARRRPGEDRALRTALLWISDPSEARRRAAHEAAEACDPASPERLAALAAFFSGGSISPANCPPVPAPRQAAGLFASGAVISAASRVSDMHKALDAALDIGAAIAEKGLDAGNP